MSKPTISYDTIHESYYCYDGSLYESVFIGKGETIPKAFLSYLECKWSKFQPRPEALINITYIDPKDMLPEWESSYTYSSGQSVRYKGKVYKLSYFADRSISSINKPPDVNYQWICQSDLNTKYEIIKTSLVEEKPKRWWEFWK